MADRKPRATREESLKSKIESNLEAQAKIVAKIEVLKAAEMDLRNQLADLKDSKKKAEKAAETKAKKAAEAKAWKELLKVISRSGLSVDDVKAKLGL